MPLISTLLGVINVVAVLLPVPVNGAGVWPATEPDDASVKVLQWPVIVLGFLILIVAVTELVGGFWGIHRLVLFYLVVMFVFFRCRSFKLSECCEPPTECGYTSVNPTYWISPMSSAANQDCMQRSNEQTQLCRGCDSCMAAMIADLRREWRRADAILLCTPTGLVVVCLVGCCLFRKAKTEELFRRYKLRHS
ncbi:unnamed protein product [Victoria cruziana]